MEKKLKQITVHIREENYLFVQGMIKRTGLSMDQWVSNIIAKEQMNLEYEDLIRNFHPSKLGSWDDLKDPNIYAAWENWIRINT